MALFTKPNGGTCIHHLQFDVSFQLQSFVAVKQIKMENLDAADGNKQLREFQAEIILMCQLRPHPNVIQFLGVCSNPLCCIVELLEGGSLYNRLRALSAL